MIARDELIAYLDEYLRVREFRDYGPQGLQVEGKPEVRKVVTAVSSSLELFQRALRVNPLDRRLREKVSSVHTYAARGHVEAGRFDAARAEYQAALAYREAADATSVLCKWAACEFKAGDPARAEELLRQALAQPGSELAVAYSMVIEVIRLKLPRGLKQRFDRDFNEALGRPATAAAAAAVAETTAARLGYAMDDRFYGLDDEGHLARFRRMMDELTVEDVNAAIKRHWQVDNLKIAIVTGEAEQMRKVLASGEPTPISYATPKPEATTMCSGPTRTTSWAAQSRRRFRRRNGCSTRRSTGLMSC